MNKCSEPIIEKNGASKQLPILLRVLAYAVCIALVLYYCLVLWWGIKPNVGIEYRMYYITHELKDWPGFGKLAYEYGTMELCTTRNESTIANTEGTICARKGEGFGEAQGEGTPSLGSDSYIYFVPTEAAKTAVLYLDITKFAGGEAKVYIQDEYAGIISSSGSYAFIVTKPEADSLLTVHIENEDAQYTLYSLELKKLE